MVVKLIANIWIVDNASTFETNSRQLFIFHQNPLILCSFYFDCSSSCNWFCEIHPNFYSQAISHPTSSSSMSTYSTIPIELPIFCLQLQFIPIRSRLYSWIRIDAWSNFIFLGWVKPSKRFKHEDIIIEKLGPTFLHHLFVCVSSKGDNKHIGTTSWDSLYAQSPYFCHCCQDNASFNESINLNFTYKT